jgi:trehalose 6-phosphate synthase/phosphatase
METLTSSKTIIVSNRLPVKVRMEAGKPVYSASEGGLATGLSSVFNNPDSRWIGWSGIATSDPVLHQEIEKELKPGRMVPVMLSEAEMEAYYQGFSNETLWPLFHYFASLAEFDHSNWETYVAVNRKFAEAIVAEAGARDIIWIHDYHLMLVPAMVREMLPDAAIGFFQHIPFPAYEMFRIVPWRNELIQGLLGANMLGFHTQDDVAHFMETVTEVCALGNPEVSVMSNEILFGNRTILVDAFPMGIDYDKFASMAVSEAIHDEMSELELHKGNRKLMISIDRLDYSKGIIHRLKAFETFLEMYPDMAGSVVFIQLIVPSRDSIKQYDRLKQEVNRLVSNINTRYGTFGWNPICYFYRSLSPEALSALYAAAEVALVTPLRDGMNLVSKEYIASKIERPGVLVLSEMAGAASELKQALIVNPNNQFEMAQAIHDALVMPVKEQWKRLKSMQRHLRKNNVHAWANGFIETLMNVCELQTSYDQYIYNEEVEEHILHRFMSRRDVGNLLQSLGLRSGSAGFLLQT